MSLSKSIERVKRLAEENPCGWSKSTLDSLAEGLDLLVSERTKNGISLMELAEYYRVTVRTIQRWRKDYDDFPKPIDPYAKVLSFPVDAVVEWKFRHREMF